MIPCTDRNKMNGNGANGGHFDRIGELDNVISFVALCRLNHISSRSPTSEPEDVSECGGRRGVHRGAGAGLRPRLPPQPEAEQGLVLLHRGAADTRAARAAAAAGEGPGGDGGARAAEPAEVRGPPQQVHVHGGPVYGILEERTHNTFKRKIWDEIHLEF